MEIGSQKESRQRTLAPRLQWSPGCGSAGHLQPLHLCRCWFGKEPGDLVDYIYQGPIILVLLVRPRWEVGQGWAPGGQQRTHPAEMLGRDRVWIGPPPHTLCMHHPAAWHPAPSSPFLELHAVIQSSPLSGPQVLGRENPTGRFLMPPTSDIPLPGTSQARRAAGGKRRVRGILFGPDLLSLYPQ